jgi:hypothetical protein
MRTIAGAIFTDYEPLHRSPLTSRLSVLLGSGHINAWPPSDLADTVGRGLPCPLGTGEGYGGWVQRPRAAVPIGRGFLPAHGGLAS